MPLDPNNRSLDLGGVAEKEPNWVEGHIVGSRVSLKFRYFDPLSDSVSPAYADIETRGRSEPHGYYVNTGWDSWSFVLNFHASVDADDGRTPEDIMSEAMQLKSFGYPSYNQGGILIRPPSLATIKIGQLLDQRGRIEGLQFTYNPPYERITMLPYHIQAAFSFIAIHDRPLSAATIRAKGNLARR